MKTNILFIVFLLLNVTSNAKTIIGRVINELGQPMAYVNVTELDQADSTFISGTITQEDGTFAINILQNNSLLRVSSLGYLINYQQTLSDNLGDIRMQPDTMMLGQVMVVGHRPIVMKEQEKIIFDIKQMPNTEAWNTKDILKFAPGIIVSSDGTLQMAGKTVTVFVNDKKLSNDELSAYLNTLKASDVDHIEIMRNHGGVKEADIQGGVINIITKRNQLGLKGSTDLYAAVPDFHYYNFSPTTNFFFGCDKWDIYGTYAYSHGSYNQYSETTNDYLFNNTRHYSKGNTHGRDISHIYRFGIVFNLKQNHNFGLEINGISQSPTNSYGLHTTAYKKAGTNGNMNNGISKTLYNAHSDFFNLVSSYSWTIDEQKSFLKILININNRNSLSNNNSKTEYQETKALDIDEKDRTATNGDNITSDLDYRKNYENGWSLRSGGKVLLSSRSSDFTRHDYLSSTLSFNEWNYKENIYSGYVGTTKSFDQLYMIANIRVEHTSIHGDAQGGSKTEKEYTNWFPYMELSYRSGRQFNYSISYYSSIHRPPFSLMNGYENRISDVLFDKGNPDLQASQTNTVEWNASYKQHSLTLSYSHESKPITELFEVIDDITYHTNVNFGEKNVVTMEYSFSGNLFSWWQSSLVLASSYKRIPNSYNKKELFETQAHWSNRMTWEKVGSLALGCFCTSPTINGNSYTEGHTSFDISFERSFCHNTLTFQMGIDDLLNNNKVKSNNKVPTLHYHVYLDNQPRQYWCNISYNFATKRKTNQNKITNINSIKNRL